MISLGIAAAIGAAIGAVALGAASAATHGDVPGLAIALQHIPPTTHGYEVVTAVKNALAGGAAGGGKCGARFPPPETRGQGAGSPGPQPRARAFFFFFGANPPPGGSLHPAPP